MPYRVLLSALVVVLLSCTPARTADTLLIVAPEAWASATAPFAAFKRSLGFSVSNTTTEALAGGGDLTPAMLRTALVAYAESSVPSNALGHVLIVGDFDVVPAPSFLVLPGDGSPYRSDVYYRDLATEFDADGDGIMAEFAEDGSGDFTGNEIRSQFPSFTNHLIVGRLPLSTSAVPADVSSALAISVAFEEEVSARKDGAIMTAGRIMDVIDLPLPFPDLELPADSWTYVLSNIVETIVTEHTNRTVTTVVHVSPSYTDRHNIDYAVEGDDITGDYTAGQQIVRGLWETNDACAFLCNVSHGGENYDFSLRRNGDGFPTNVAPAVVLSMSCASYPLGVSAWESGIAVAYVGSVANVTPDSESLEIILSWPPEVSGMMVSAEVQEIATLRVFVERQGIGHAFSEALEHYIAELPDRNGGAFLDAHPESALRNIIGYQIIGDPTLVVSYDDTDSDGLLDPQEVMLGTSVTNSNTDGDPQTDYQEYVADTDGADSNNYFRVADMTGPSPLTMHFDSSSNRWYTMDVCSNLLAAQWTNVPGAGPKMGEGGSDWLQETNASEDGLFYRIRVYLP